MTLSNCEKAHQCMDQIVLGTFLSQEEERDLNSHLEQCELCQKRWDFSEKLSLDLQTSLQNVASSFQSPKARILLQLEIEPLPQARSTGGRPWRWATWGVVFLTLLLVVVSYVGLMTAHRIWKIRIQKRVFRDMGEIVEERKGLKGGWALHNRRDPWGQAYWIEQEGPHRFTIYSFGPNGKDEKGGSDDLWTRWVVGDKIYLEKSSFLKDLHFKKQKE